MNIESNILPAPEDLFFSQTIPAPVRIDKRCLERLRFWETESFFSCPLIGLCLTVSEQRQLLKKSGVSFKQRTLFDIHEILVASSKTENLLSRKVDDLLARKYSRLTEYYLEHTEAELVQEWRKGFDAGDYTALLWFLSTRRQLSESFRREIFGDIHMSMHDNSELQAEMKRRFEFMQKRYNRMEQKVAAEINKRKEAHKQAAVWQTHNTELQEFIAEAQKRQELLGSQLEVMKNQQVSEELAALRQENSQLKAEQEQLSAMIKRFEQRVMRLEADNKRLAKELSRQLVFEDRLREEFQEILLMSCGPDGCNQSCPSFDLCRKRVLIVGGISKMEPLYRQVVERSGGVFEYHDGYVKGGVSRLECSLKRADIVLCPVNCNSHAACTLVKHLGKKHQKPVQMLSGSGLNAIVRGIQTVDRAAKDGLEANT